MILTRASVPVGCVDVCVPVLWYVRTRVQVVALVIVRPGKEGVDADEVGKVFVEFGDVEICKKAATGLNNVKFDDRTVETDFDSTETMEKLKGLFPEQLALVPQ